MDISKDNSPFSGRYFSDYKKKSILPITGLPIINSLQKTDIDKPKSTRNVKSNNSINRSSDFYKAKNVLDSSESSASQVLQSNSSSPSKIKVTESPKPTHPSQPLKKQVQVRKRKFDTSFSNNEMESEGKRSRLSPLLKDEPFTLSEIRNLFEQDVFSQEIRRYFNENTQQDWYLERKWNLAKSLESTLNAEMLVSCEIHIVGSSVNGFGRFNSDCDMCVVVDKHTDILSISRVMRVLSLMQKLLRHASFVRNLQLIPAKVRILKFRDCKSNMDIDINVNNLIGLRNTQLMFAYSQHDPRVRPLILCIKEWAHQNDINDASLGTLSSYALALMVLHYLQVGVHPCVVPSLQERFPSHFSLSVPIDEIEERARSIPYSRSSNRQSLADLLIGFFRYYSTFDFKKVISVRTARCFPVSEYLTSGPWHRKKIRIEEPFDRSNVARAVRDLYFNRILTCFQQANTRLKRNGKLRDLMQVTRRSRQTTFGW